MKKALSVVLTLALLSTGAFAAEWAAGCSPENPYADAQGKPVDFNETIGYMMLAPIRGSVTEANLHSVTVYMPREDIETGAGTLYLTDAAAKKTTEIELTDANFTGRAMTEEELGELLWGCGTAFTAEFGVVLPADTKYIVQLSEGAVTAPAYEGSAGKSPAIAGKDAWTFTTASVNGCGIEGMYILRGAAQAEAPVYAVAEDAVITAVPEDALPAGAALQTGDTVHLAVRVGGEAESACFVLYDGSIEADETWYEADTEVTVTLTESGTAVWGILWQNADGEIVDSVTFDYTVG